MSFQSSYAKFGEAGVSQATSKCITSGEVFGTLYYNFNIEKLMSIIAALNFIIDIVIRFLYCKMYVIP